MHDELPLSICSGGLAASRHRSKPNHEGTSLGCIHHNDNSTLILFLAKMDCDERVTKNWKIDALAPQLGYTFPIFDVLKASVA